MGGRKQKKASMRLPISTPERRAEDKKPTEIVAKREDLDRILKDYVDNMDRLEAKRGKRNDE